MSMLSRLKPLACLGGILTATFYAKKRFDETSIENDFGGEIDPRVTTILKRNIGIREGVLKRADTVNDGSVAERCYQMMTDRKKYLVPKMAQAIFFMFSTANSIGNLSKRVVNIVNSAQIAGDLSGACFDLKDAILGWKMALKGGNILDPVVESIYVSLILTGDAIIATKNVAAVPSFLYERALPKVFSAIMLPYLLKGGPGLARSTSMLLRARKADNLFTFLTKRLAIHEIDRDQDVAVIEKQLDGKIAVLEEMIGSEKVLKYLKILINKDELSECSLESLKKDLAKKMTAEIGKCAIGLGSLMAGICLKGKVFWRANMVFSAVSLLIMNFPYLRLVPFRPDESSSSLTFED